MHGQIENKNCISRTLNLPLIAREYISDKELVGTFAQQVLKVNYDGGAVSNIKYTQLTIIASKENKRVDKNRIAP